MNDFPDDIKTVSVVTDGKAFAGSSAISRPSNNPVVTFTWKSNDTETVHLEILIDGVLKYNVQNIKPGASGSISYPAAEFAGRTIKHCRWRPGLFGINGAGGGDAVWVCPVGESVRVNLVLNVS
ncbi:hypothetical protein FDP41_007170 [Naegleria fowleri]|uniref:Uncharacterized protein n=1 Tax=Naegleria fowleri TaxID=5763 RepID=A0A6A5B4U7_NAEFO|nr:uncharacterized protein FDP41_007170 [Naegleria fowleri]KAF0973783.1 hypothetical protein FDP41_007170 [Naegleria fowleri]